MGLIFPGVGRPVVGVSVEISQVIGGDCEGHLTGSRRGREEPSGNPSVPWPDAGGEP